MSIDDPRVGHLLEISARLEAFYQLIAVARRVFQEEEQAGDEEASNGRSVISAATVVVTAVYRVVFVHGLLLQGGALAYPLFIYT
jgi:hypothetical protein